MILREDVLGEGMFYLGMWGGKSGLLVALRMLPCGRTLGSACSRINKREWARRASLFGSARGEIREKETRFLGLFAYSGVLSWESKRNAGKDAPART